MNYEPLHAFAEKHRVPYNELCTALRSALAAPMPEPVAKFHCYEMVDVGEVMLMPHTGPKLKHGDLLYAAPRKGTT